MLCVVLLLLPKCVVAVVLAPDRIATLCHRLQKEKQMQWPFGLLWPDVCCGIRLSNCLKPLRLRSLMYALRMSALSEAVLWLR
jgi:hypothetical protein